MWNYRFHAARLSLSALNEKTAGPWKWRLGAGLHSCHFGYLTKDK
jgi:hypothetical protein